MLLHAVTGAGAGSELLSGAEDLLLLRFAKHVISILSVLNKWQEAYRVPLRQEGT